MEHCEQIKRIFDEASALEAVARRALVARACAGDGELPDEVRSLLEADIDGVDALKTAHVGGGPRITGPDRTVPIRKP